MSAQLLQEISDSIKFGDKAHARELLDQVLREQPSAEAWYLAAQVTESLEETQAALKKALALDPTHANAQRALAALGAMPAPAPKPESPAPQATPPPAAPHQRKAPRVEGGQTIYDEGTYEMLWDCKYCGTQKLLGKTHRFCPQCGATQDPEWRYYPSDDEKIAVRDHVYVGADHTCPACGTLQAANVEFCTRCGAPQTDAARVKVQQARTSAQAFGADDLSLRQQREFDAATGRQSLASQGTSKGGANKGLIIGAAVIGIALVGFLLYALFATREATVTVTDFTWERAVTVEQLVPVPGKVACNAVPIGAYNIVSRVEQIGSRQVPDGETCTNRQVDQGDGTFRSERVCVPKYRSEPVYGEMCSFVTNQWLNDRNVTANGARGTAPYWPEVKLAREGNCVGCERVGAQTETFTAQFVDADGKTFACEVPKAFWDETAVRTTFKIQVKQIGGAPNCNSLERDTPQ